MFKSRQIDLNFFIDTFACLLAFCRVRERYIKSPTKLA
ncbi:Uncharacterised protein [Vibrio cholerae]|nr:Uncharacterised protein [Vibrio cholerae]